MHETQQAVVCYLTYFLSLNLFYMKQKCYWDFLYARKYYKSPCITILIMSRGRFLKVLFCPLNDWAGFVSKSTVISFATENWKKERKTRKTKRRRREGGRKRGKERGKPKASSRTTVSVMQLTAIHSTNLCSWLDHKPQQPLPFAQCYGPEQGRGGRSQFYLSEKVLSFAFPLV